VSWSTVAAVFAVSRHVRKEGTNSAQETAAMITVPVICCASVIPADCDRAPRYKLLTQKKKKKKKKKLSFGFYIYVENGGAASALNITGVM
jgi:predicted nucleic acid binding AN1-type Zn finger protein